MLKSFQVKGPRPLARAVRFALSAGRHRLVVGLLVALVAGLAAAPAVAEDDEIIFDSWVDIGDGETESVTLTGDDPDWILDHTLTIGLNGGDGTLSLQDGARVQISTAHSGWASIYVGYHEGAIGSLFVDGNGTLLELDQVLRVGYEGASGLFELSNGGHVSGTLLNLGGFGGGSGQATVTGTGSLLEMSSEVLLQSGASFDLTGGGRVEANRMRIAPSSLAGDPPEAIVSGNGSELIVADYIQVGGFGHGDLTIEDRGYAQSLGGRIATRDSGEQSVVTIQDFGSRWDVLEDLHVGGSELLGQGGSGVINLTNNGRLGVGGGLVLWNEGQVNMTGAWLWADTIDASEGGTLSTDDTSSVYVNTLTGFGDAVDFGGNLSFGHTGGEGSHTVGAGQSLTTGGALVIGENAAAELIVENGGQVSSDIGVIGLFSPADAQVTLSGAGSHWSIDQHLSLGHNIGTSGSLTLEAGASADAGELRVAGSDVLITGAGSALNVGEAEIGHVRVGSLSVADGGVFTSQGATVGDNFDSAGAVSVAGAGSEWINEGFLSLGGFSGQGELSVTDGGFVSTQGVRVGLASDTPAGISSLVVDGGTLDNDGGLSVTPIGTALFASGATVTARAATVTGELEITGPGTTVDLELDVPGFHGALRVRGEEGGSVLISDGAVLTSEEGYVGEAAGDTDVTIEGAGAKWHVTGPLLRVGVSDPGTTATLDMRDGGQLAHDGDVEILGFQEGNSAVASVSGEGAGWSGSGSLRVGAAVVDDDTFVGEGQSSFLVNDGAAVQVDGGTHVYGEGVFTLAGGSLSTPTIDISEGGTFAFTGGTLRTDDFVGALHNAGGSLLLELHSPQLYVEGNFTQSAGSLVLELDGDAGQQQLITSGSFTAGGVLEVVAASDFEFAEGMSFDLFDFSGPQIEGEFETVLLPHLQSDLLVWDTGALLTSGSIGVSVIPEPATAAFWALASGLVLVRRRRRRTIEA